MKTAYSKGKSNIMKDFKKQKIKEQELERQYLQNVDR
jgi:hypothetical protein